MSVREITPFPLHGSMSTVRLRAFVLVVLALAVAACTSSRTVSPTTTTVPRPLPAIDLSATPSGWVPVADGDAQISVPATWWVLYNVGCPTGSPPGEVVVNPVISHCPPAMTAKAQRMSFG